MSARATVPLEWEEATIDTAVYFNYLETSKTLLTNQLVIIKFIKATSVFFQYGGCRPAGVVITFQRATAGTVQNY